MWELYVVELVIVVLSVVFIRNGFRRRRELKELDAARDRAIEAVRSRHRLYETEHEAFEGRSVEWFNHPAECHKCRDIRNAEREKHDRMTRELEQVTGIGPPHEFAINDELDEGPNQIGILKIRGSLTPEEADAVRERFIEDWKRLERVPPAILGPGVKFKPVVNEYGIRIDSVCICPTGRDSIRWDSRGYLVHGVCNRYVHHVERQQPDPAPYEEWLGGDSGKP